MNSAVVTLPKVLGVVVTDDTLSIDFDDGCSFSVPIGWYPRLAHGTVSERRNFQISGAGYGVHWPDLDEDIGVEGFLLRKRSAESAISFKRWLERRRENLQQHGKLASGPDSELRAGSDKEHLNKKRQAHLQSVTESKSIRLVK